MTTTRVLRYVLSIAALVLPFAKSSQAATNCGSPGPNQAIVWKDINFSGNCDVLEIGNYPFSAVNAMSVGNDAISAVSVGSNVKVTLFEHDLPPHAGAQGDWMPVIASRNVVSDFNDKTSSLRVASRTNCASPGSGQVVVWADINFTGNCDVLDFGFPVPFAKITGLSVGNDTVSSIKCASGFGAKLWQNDLSGSSFSAGDACSINFLSTFNDETSSIVPTIVP